jgi:hypothetical protein
MLLSFVYVHKKGAGKVPAPDSQPEQYLTDVWAVPIKSHMFMPLINVVHFRRWFYGLHGPQRLLHECSLIGAGGAGKTGCCVTGVGFAGGNTFQRDQQLNRLRQRCAPDETQTVKRKSSTTT